MSWAKHIAGNHRIPWQKKITFSYLDPGDTLENKLNDLKPSYSRKKSFAFQRSLKKCSCLGGWILPTRINNNHRKLRCMSCTIHDLSVWKNHWSTHVNIVPLAKPSKRFLPSHPPPPAFISWFSFHFLRSQNQIPFHGLFFARNRTE